MMRRPRLEIRKEGVFQLSLKKLVLYSLILFFLFLYGTNNTTHPDALFKTIFFPLLLFDTLPELSTPVAVVVFIPFFLVQLLAVYIVVCIACFPFRKTKFIYHKNR